MAVVKAEHLRRQPGRNVHAVGDVPDGNFVFGLAGIEAGPHGARHFAVQRGNGIGAAREFQAQHGHAEIFVRVAGILASQRHQPLVGEPKRLAQRPQMLFHQVRRQSGRGRRAPECAW